MVWLLTLAKWGKNRLSRRMSPLQQITVLQQRVLPLIQDVVGCGTANIGGSCGLAGGAPAAGDVATIGGLGSQCGGWVCFVRLGVFCWGGNCRLEPDRDRDALSLAFGYGFELVALAPSLPCDELTLHS